MQQIIGDVVGFDIIPELFLRPFPQRVDLDQVEVLVPLNKLQIVACYRLLGTQSADPCFGAGKCTPHGEDLADMATFFPVLYAFIEEVDALAVHHGFNIAGRGKEYLYGNIIPLICFIQQVEGFREEPAGIQGEYADFGRDCGKHMRDHLIFGAKAGGKCDLIRVFFSKK